jgi:hypothetical protein
MHAGPESGPMESELLGLLDALCNGPLDPEQHDRLGLRLRDDPEARRAYIAYIDLHLGLGKLSRLEGGGRVSPAGDSTSPSRRKWAATRWAGLGVAAALLIAATLAIATRGTRPGGGAAVVATADREVRPLLAHSSGARFFGGRGAADGARLAFGTEYALTEGSLEIQFVDGATAIIEAPAVFAVADRARLVMRLGPCSVHAPAGAEGFRVETPMAEVVDLGTRFSVDVSDTGEADVQVVEGMAEVHTGGAQRDRAPPARLTTGQARRYAIRREDATQAIAYDASRYTASLPDGVVAYEASERESGGGAEELTSVTVRRGGSLHTYPADDLVGIDLIHFGATVSTHNITTVTGEVDPGGSDRSRRLRRAALLDRDRNLNTGVINPGGSRLPLTADPVFNDPEDPGVPNTPGFAVRFLRPLVNAPGPDVVLFELQVIVHPERGDPFHVSPLRFGPGLRTHTVRSYDIDLSSPEARTLAGFRLYRFDSPPRTLGELLRGRHNEGFAFQVGTKAIAVGIDLSDLGYPPGAVVDGLFFQDADDDKNLVDPVVIVGLPPLEPPLARGGGR